MKKHTFAFGDFSKKYIPFLFVLTNGKFYDDHKIVVTNAI